MEHKNKAKSKTDKSSHLITLKKIKTNKSKWKINKIMKIKMKTIKKNKNLKKIIRKLLQTRKSSLMLYLDQFLTQQLLILSINFTHTQKI